MSETGGGLHDDERTYWAGRMHGGKSGDRRADVVWHTQGSGKSFSMLFCLCAALLTTRPPPLIVINEPEASLHPDLIPPLAELVAKVSNDTQILIVTHSRELATEIETRCEAKVVDLVSFNGETRQAGQGASNRIWTFDGDD